MFNAFKKIYHLLSPKDQKIAFLLFVCMFVMGVLEVMGIALVVPFMMVVADPDAAMHHQKIAWLYAALGYSSVKWFLFALGLVVLCVLVFGNVFAAFVSWLMFRFSAAQEHKLSERLLSRYLYKPYVFYVSHNTSDLSKNILSEIACVTDRVIRAGLELLAKILVVLFILTLLIYVDPALALMVSGVLGGSYVCIYWMVRPTLLRLSQRQMMANKMRFKVVSESMSGIKDLKLLGREKTLLSRFGALALEYGRARALGMTIETAPKYFLESIAFGGIVMIVLYLLAVKHDFSQVIPFLALYAFAGYRLMPSLQVIYKHSVGVRTNIPVLNALYQDLCTQENIVYPMEVKALSFVDNITLQDVSFQYENTDKCILQHINLMIKHNTTVGFVGETGAGKTTVVDVILGLLEPTEGEVSVDGVMINPVTVRAWQKNIGYVSQSIFLLDDSILCNIAYGVPYEDIQVARVIDAARLANISEFIDTLKDSYQTIVGERGVRLSGGQRQRIGIARALYRDPALLILDEATSALDNATEDVILKSIQALAHQKTIVVIAHRLTTIRACDVIYVLEKGCVVGCGTYEVLLASNAHFQRIAMVK